MRAFYAFVFVCIATCAYAGNDTFWEFRKDFGLCSFAFDWGGRGEFNDYVINRDLSNRESHVRVLGVVDSGFRQLVFKESQNAGSHYRKYGLKAFLDNISIGDKIVVVKGRLFREHKNGTTSYIELSDEVNTLAISYFDANPNILRESLMQFRLRGLWSIEDDDAQLLEFLSNEHGRWRDYDSSIFFSSKLLVFERPLLVSHRRTNTSIPIKLKISLDFKTQRFSLKFSSHLAAEAKRFMHMTDPDPQYLVEAHSLEGAIDRFDGKAEIMRNDIKEFESLLREFIVRVGVYDVSDVLGDAEFE